MLGPHFDPLGETEPHTTKYTLTVLCPPRPPPHWLPAIFTRPPAERPNAGTTYRIRPSDFDPVKPNYDCFELRHLGDMTSKTVKITSAWFPTDMRCEHIHTEYKCEEGCYVLEKGGDLKRWVCKRQDCEGHVYCGRVIKDGKGVACFGKKGERMVCVQR